MPPGDLESDSKDPALKDQVKLFPRAATYYIGLNQKAFPAFKDVRVRQALAYATDKNKIVQVVFARQARRGRGHPGEGIPGFDPDFQGPALRPRQGQSSAGGGGPPERAGPPAHPDLLPAVASPNCKRPWT